MPSRTRRNYRGGGSLENCQTYAKKNKLTPDQINKCADMIKGITFTSGGMFSSSKATRNDGESFTPTQWDTFWQDEVSPAAIENKRMLASQQAETDRINKEQQKQREAAAEQARIAAIPACNGYNKKTDTYVYKNPKTGQMGQCNSTNKLNDCTKWSSTKDNRGNPKDWFVTDNNGNLCKIKDKPVSPEGTNLYETSSRTDYARLHPSDPAPLMRRSKTEYGGIPINYPSPSDEYDWILNPIPDTKRGGRRSRRKSRKSRR